MVQLLIMCCSVLFTNMSVLLPVLIFSANSKCFKGNGEWRSESNFTFLHFGLKLWPKNNKQQQQQTTTIRIKTRIMCKSIFDTVIGKDEYTL